MLTKMFKFCVINLLVCSALVAALPTIHAQSDQSGFISIDCGLSESSNYTDRNNGINYTSDAGFIDSGVNVAISSTVDIEKPFLSVRSFPEGNRSCYTLRPEIGKQNKYLISAHFMYGNYDGKNQLPQFELYIGEDYWVNVSIEKVDNAYKWEIIHTPSTDFIHICLHKTGSTIPFISALELRPFNNSGYLSGSLMVYQRWDFGSASDRILRYPLDVYDRMWQPRRGWSSTDLSISTNLTVQQNPFKIPSAVLSTAARPLIPNDSLYLSWEPPNPSDQFYMYLHFAEVEKLQNHEFREIQIYLNGKLFRGPLSPPYLETVTIFTTSPLSVETKYEVSINSTENSTLPPIINAMELYKLRQFINSGTNDGDAAAIFSIKSYYRLKKNWQGDPCVPRDFTWEGLGCNYDDFNPAIISLNLSSSGLNGSVAPHFANFAFIRILDLSNNNLDGNVPEFLAQLDSLKVLNLAGNSFSGPIPAKLLEKSNQRSLSLSINGLQNKASKPRKKVIVAIVASTLATFLVIIFVFITICKIRKSRKEEIKKVDKNLHKDNGGLGTKRRSVTYSEVLEITNNFKRVLGKGGFGTVYYGLMGDIEVAVKMLNPSSTQGYEEFQTEANLLMSVHHMNITSLVGYCNESSHIGIIYEYMANGNLQQHLSELSWERRLRIAVDSAQGLEYMHHGCKPPIIHRDIKPSNILLNHNFQAKLSDFGLSKTFSSDANSHVLVNTVAGTLGYLDPECHYSPRLTERSDVYSFGVVLLEIVSRRPVIDNNDENRHISNWVLSLLEKGDINTIVDDRLEGNFNIDSAMKIVELATSCVAFPSSKRPTMYNVLVELKECLATEMSNVKTEVVSQTGSVVESDYGYLAR